MKCILINARHAEEIRVALVEDGRLSDFDVQMTSHHHTKSNIYKGRIVRTEPSIEAAFVDYGEERHGFLPLKEITPSYLRYPSNHKCPINEQLAVGDELIVQVDKEARDNKGAALTTFLSLAGRYLVILLENPRPNAISRRLNREERQQARAQLSQLQAPENFGIILRTAGVGKSFEMLKQDLDNLSALWKRINTEAQDRAAPCLIFRESDIVVRTIRDHLNDSIDKVLVDDHDVYEAFVNLVGRLNPAQCKIIDCYEDSVPLFSHYQVEGQIASAYQNQIRLPSGASIVIDQTEALVAIDINSSQAKRGGDIEETAYNSNLEAAAEIARQLRIRDLGGLIVIDFIDMSRMMHQRQVKKHLVESLAQDRARVQVGEISRFGLLEMTRQRLRPSLLDTTSAVCPRCHGHGKVRSTESMGLTMMRLLGEQVAQAGAVQVRAQLPASVAAFLLNEKRREFVELEQQFQVSIIIVPSPGMQSPNFTITRLHKSGATHVIKDEENRITDGIEKLYTRKIRQSQEPVIQNSAPFNHSNQDNLWLKIKRILSGGATNTASAQPQPSAIAEPPVVEEQKTFSRPPPRRRGRSSSRTAAGEFGNENRRSDHLRRSRIRPSSRTNQRSTENNRVEITKRPVAEGTGDGKARSSRRTASSPAVRQVTQPSSVSSIEVAFGHDSNVKSERTQSLVNQEGVVNDHDVVSKNNRAARDVIKPQKAAITETAAILPIREEQPKKEQSSPTHKPRRIANDPRLLRDSQAQTQPIEQSVPPSQHQEEP